MNIGYLYNFNSYPPGMGRSVHANQILTGLLKRGHNLHVLDLETMLGVKRYPKTKEGLESLFKNIDVLCIRLDGDHFECDLSLEKLIPYNLPVVLEINSPISEFKAWFKDMGSRTGLNLKLRWEIRSLESERKKLAGKVSAAICVSDEMEKYAKEFLKIKKVYAIPNGSDPEAFSPDSRDEKLYSIPAGCFKILWVGNMELPWHDGRLALDVAGKMLLQDNQCQFIFLTKASSFNFKLPDNVMLMDEVSYKDVPKYISSVDACLCLYNMKPWCEWGFYLSPLKLFDYMACGRPVIATNIGQVKEIIKNGVNGLLVDNDVDEIIKKLIYLKKNKEEADKIGQMARESILELYNWPRVVEETERIFNNVVIKGKE